MWLGEKCPRVFKSLWVFSGEWVLMGSYGENIVVWLMTVRYMVLCADAAQCR